MLELILFPYKKVFIKKKVCLPTDPKIFGHVTGNEAYFSFGIKILEAHPGVWEQGEFYVWVQEWG